MKTAFVLASVLAGALALAPGPAVAWSSHGGSPLSGFGPRVDPWRHWGPLQLQHRQIVPHRSFRHHPGVIVVPRGHHRVAPVWIPGGWAWNGFAWFWVPGYWIR
jgi:hypothetical protein